VRRAPNPILVTAVLSIAAVGAYFVVRGFGGGSVGGPGAGDSAPNSAVAIPELAETLPQFVLDDLAGEPTASSSWPGKPLVVNFWATWCAPCLREIPMLKAFQADHPDVQVVGIAIDRETAVRRFAEDMQFNYPVLVGPTAMDAAAAFGVGYVALPLTMFVGADEAVLGAHLGELHEEHLENFTATLAGIAGGEFDLAQARARMQARQ
jgi:thiol-disulfide isomerase/thioredoxin